MLTQTTRKLQASNLNLKYTNHKYMTNKLYKYYNQTGMETLCTKIASNVLVDLPEQNKDGGDVHKAGFHMWDCSAPNIDCNLVDLNPNLDIRPPQRPPNPVSDQSTLNNLHK